MNATITLLLSKLTAIAALIIAVVAALTLLRRRHRKHGSGNPGTAERAAAALLSMIAESPERDAPVTPKPPAPVRPKRSIGLAAVTGIAIVLALFSAVCSFWKEAAAVSVKDSAIRKVHTHSSISPELKETVAPNRIINVHSEMEAEPRIASASIHPATTIKSETENKPPVIGTPPPLPDHQDTWIANQSAPMNRQSREEMARIPLQIAWPEPSDMPTVIHRLGLRLALPEEPVKTEVVLTSSGSRTQNFDASVLASYASTARVLTPGSIHGYDGKVYVLVPVSLADTWERAKIGAIRAVNVRAVGVQAKLLPDGDSFTLHVYRVIPAD